MRTESPMLRRQAGAFSATRQARVTGNPSTGFKLFAGLRTALRAAAALLAFGCGMARAADAVLSKPVAQNIYRADAFGVRFGGYDHCCFQESGSAALGVEIVAPRLVHWAQLPDFFSPRFHFGSVVDLGGHTSYGYAGFLFTQNFMTRFFIEPFIGIAVSNGVPSGDATHVAIGCKTLIHSGGNIGYRIDSRWSVMFSLDHISNGGLCDRNVGVNNYGAKIGYSF